MARIVKKFKSKDILIIPILMAVFALGGSTFGMAEETLPFFAILLPIVMAMGYDSITAFMIVFVLYARRVKKNPESSIAYADDIEKRKEHASNDELLEADFTGRQKAVIIGEQQPGFLLVTHKAIDLLQEISALHGNTHVGNGREGDCYRVC